MSREASAVRPGDLVCVTGANGFIASHLVRDLLQAGFRVRGTVRDPDDASKTDHLRRIAAAADAADRLELVRGDLLQPGSFDRALAGCDALCHCAAAVFFAASDPQREIVDPSVEGTRNVLRSAHAAGTVRRVVHTSSMAAVYSWDAPAARRFTEDDWNTTSTLSTDPYGLSKVSAERAALELVAQLPEDERFDLVHLHPGMVWGPPMIKAHAKASPKLLRDILSRAMPGVPQLMLSVVDVREVSAAHVAALTSDAPPPRCLLVAEDAWMPELAAQLQSLFPEIRMATRRLPKLAILAASLLDANLNTRQLHKLVGRALPMDGALSASAYGVRYRSIEQTLRDTAQPMIDEGWARVQRR